MEQYLSNSRTVLYRSKPGGCSDTERFRLRQHGTVLSFFTKNVAHGATFFVKKGWFLPPCRRRYLLPDQEPGKPGYLKGIAPKGS